MIKTEWLANEQVSETVLYRPYKRLRSRQKNNHLPRQIFQVAQYGLSIQEYSRKRCFFRISYFCLLISSIAPHTALPPSLNRDFGSLVKTSGNGLQTVLRPAHNTPIYWLMIGSRQTKVKGKSR